MQVISAGHRPHSSTVGISYLVEEVSMVPHIVVNSCKPKETISNWIPSISRKIEDGLSSCHSIWMNSSKIGPHLSSSKYPSWFMITFLGHLEKHHYTAETKLYIYISNTVYTRDCSSAGFSKSSMGTVTSTNNFWHGLSVETCFHHVPRWRLCWHDDDASLRSEVWQMRCYGGGLNLN